MKNLIYVCLTCLTEYDEIYRSIYESSIQSYRYEGIPCLIKDCPGEVVELDEFIAPAVMNLNEKGYRTRYCCSGHIIANRSPHDFYVSFEDFVEFRSEDINKLPVGFVVNQNEKGIIIRYRPEMVAENTIEKMEGVVQCNKVFYQWTENLSDAPDD